MVDLPEHPTLPALQRYLDEVCKERGWTKDSYAEKFLLFTEEIGELAKAIRRTQGLYQEKARQKHVESDRTSSIMRINSLTSGYVVGFTFGR